MNKKITALLFGVIIIEAGLLTGFIFEKKEYSLQALAQQTLEKCRDVAYKPGCYDQEIPKLMSRVSMEEAFQIASIVQDQDSSYGYCHILGHELSAIEAEKNIDEWSSVLKRCPSGICSNGCLHGAAQQRYKNETLTDAQIETAKQELIGVCEPDGAAIDTDLEVSECFHGLGHLSVYLSGADLRKSVEVCGSIGISKTGEDYQKLCYEGLFMQVFQPADAEEADLVLGLAPRKNELHEFCKKFLNEAVTEACWREGFILYGGEVLTSQGTVDFCLQSGEDYREGCFIMLYYVKTQSSNYNQDDLALYCSQMPDNLRAECFGQVANAIIHGGNKNIAKAVAFCELANDPPDRSGCFETILEYSDYNLGRGSEPYNLLCSLLEPKYKNTCLETI